MVGDALVLWLYGVLPLWIAAGFVDWWCHRRTAIEHNSGWRESAFHCALFAQMGAATLMTLLLEPTPAVLAILAAAIVAHEATTWLELRFVVGRRAVRPFEQMVHSFMETLPLAGLLLLALTPPATGAAGLALRHQPLPAATLVGLCVASLVFNVVPLLEELWRCLRAARPVG